MNEMQIESVRPVCFSPTGTTKAVIGAIARGCNAGSAEMLDITGPAARRKFLKTSEHDLLIVGVPVYLGRIPALAAGWLQMLEAQDTPAVCVVLYGNRAYDDALLELFDILTTRGCRPIAGAAFIGVHSFSMPDTPTAQGRPDAHDLQEAAAFGRKIREKVFSLPASGIVPGISFPGVRPYRMETCHPYRKGTPFWNVDFIAVSDACTQCGTCAKVCPVGAVDPENSSRIDTEQCITCCACIRHCPVQARTIKPGIVRDASVRLFTNFAGRKEPEYFI